MTCQDKYNKIKLKLNCIVLIGRKHICKLTCATSTLRIYEHLIKSYVLILRCHIIVTRIVKFYLNTQYFFTILNENQNPFITEYTDN